MSILIGRYEFEGPFSRLESIKNIPGVYAVLSYNNGTYDLLDIDQAEGLRTAIEDHRSYDYWIRNCSGVVSALMHYTPQSGLHQRQEIVHEILQEFHGNFDNHGTMPLVS